MEQLPVEWIERIFKRLDDIFGEAWSSRIKGKEHMYTIMWQTGTIGLTADHIKMGLHICERMSKEGLHPPSVIEFVDYAKGSRYPHFKTTNKYVPVNREYASACIKTMQSFLGRKRHEIEVGSTVRA